MILHCFSCNCQLPAKASGRNRKGNLSCIIPSHPSTLLLHKPDISGIKKRKLIPINKGDRKKRNKLGKNIPVNDRQ